MKEFCGPPTIARIHVLGGHLDGDFGIGLSMEIYGSIVAPAGSPPLERPRWATLCKQYPNLAPIPPRKSPNPFKPGQTMEIRSPDDAVHVMVSGQQIGSMGWAEDDSPLVNVEGEGPEFEKIAREIAAQLAAEFIADDE